ncbi:MFS transporter [Corynebacterium uberis]|uniref:MFS transporter n=2 Tax=Corynebacteriaceae TaxID=1653 RepID=UPI001D0AA641|nr:MFS transporter [Corynebacterium uberis]MCZ9309825.1 MFS transporter [Corynebacterium sp. c6VSa_13]UDL73623.1 MFS transporter [Corynebacterium uberis]
MSTVDTMPHRRWIFLAVISTGLFLLGVDNSILFTALPQLQELLGATDLQALWIINAYPLVMSGLLLGTGTLGDRIGHRRMFLIGLALFTSGSLCSGLAPGPWWLVAARALLGFGAATMMPATLALIRHTFSRPRELNIAIGLWGAVAMVGSAMGPVIGGALLEHFWWGSVFLINVPVGILALALTPLVAPPNVADPTRRWDIHSSALALVFLVAMVLAIKIHQPRVLLPLLVLAVVTGWAFGRRQHRLAEPLLELAIFKNPVFSGGVLAAAAACFISAGMEFMTTQRLQLALGMTPLEAGLTVTVAAAAAMPMSVLGGAILHRTGFVPLISGGFLLCAVGCAVTVLAVLGGGHGVLLIGLAFIGAGCGAVMSVSSTAIVGSAPLNRAGMASGVEEVSYEFGHLLAVAILGTTWAQISPYDAAYLAAIGILTAVAVASAAVTARCLRA